MSHTPGPWIAEPGPENRQRVFREGTHQEVALVNSPEDAHLIATAPELLATLKGVVAQGHSFPMPEWFRQAEAAIAKAEGRPDA